MIRLDIKGNIQAEKDLVGLARLQHKIMRDHMVFNDLKQYSRALYLVDGSVIIAKSCYDLDEVFIYTPLVEPEVRKPEYFRAINFVSVEQQSSTTTRLVHFYDFDGVWLRTVNLNNHLNTPVACGLEGTAYAIDKRVTLVAADGDQDAVFVHAWINNWRNYPSVYTTENNETFCFNHLGLVRIPITEEKDPVTKESLVPELLYDFAPYFVESGTDRPDFGPNVFTFTKGGLFWSTTYLDTLWNGTLGIYNNNLAYLFTDSGTFITGLYANTPETIFSVYFDQAVSDYRFHSPNYILMRKCSCVFYNLHIVAVEVLEALSTPPNNTHLVTTSHVKYCIGVWPSAVIDDKYSESLLTSYGNMTDLLTLTEDQYKHLAQIVVFGSNFYLFYDSQTFETITPYVEAYTLNPDTLKLDFIKSRTFSRDTLDRVTILRMELTDDLVKELDLEAKLGDSLVYESNGEWLPRYVVCYRLISEWAEPDVMYSDLSIMDLETFIDIKAVSLPQRPCLGYLVPIPSFAQKRVNEERAKEPGTEMYYLNSTAFPKYTMPIRKVSNDYVLQYIMGQHLRWCVENLRMSHDGVNGSQPIERACLYGYINVAEILTLTSIDTLDANESVEEAIQSWLESPSHKATMVNYRHTAMGLAMAIFPEGTESITVGAGMHLGGGSYSTGDTAVDTGPCKLFGILFAGG